MVSLDSLLELDELWTIRNPGSYPLCGLIVYKQTQANVVRALRDFDIQQEINAISSKYWDVFLVRPLEPKIRKIEGGGSSKYMSCLRFVEKETANNQMILDALGISDSDNAPCFIIFGKSEDNTMQAKAYKLKFDNPEIAHNEIREILDTASKELRRIDNENKVKDTVFRDVTNALDEKRSRVELKIRYEKIINLFSHVSKLKAFLALFT